MTRTGKLGRVQARSIGNRKHNLRLNNRHQAPHRADRIHKKSRDRELAKNCPGVYTSNAANGENKLLDRDTIIKHAAKEYLLHHPSETEAERAGRRAAIRGLMVRLGIYGAFCDMRDMQADGDYYTRLVAARCPEFSAGPQSAVVHMLSMYGGVSPMMVTDMRYPSIQCMAAFIQRSA